MHCIHWTKRHIWKQNPLSLISYSPRKTHDRKANPLAVAGCWEAQYHSDNFTRTFDEPVASTEPSLPESLCWLSLYHAPLQKHRFFSLLAEVGNRHTFKCTMPRTLVKTTLNCNTEEKSPDRIQPCNFGTGIMQGKHCCCLWLPAIVLWITFLFYLTATDSPLLQVISSSLLNHFLFHVHWFPQANSTLLEICVLVF